MTLGPVRSGWKAAVQLLQKDAGLGAEEYVMMIWSPRSGRPLLPLPFRMNREAAPATGVTRADGAEAGPGPTGLVAVTVKV